VTVVLNGLVGWELVALRGVSAGDRSLAVPGTPNVTLEARGPRPGAGTGTAVAAGAMSARGERIGDRVAPVRAVGSSKVLEEPRGSAGLEVVGGALCTPSKLGADASCCLKKDQSCVWLSAGLMELVGDTGRNSEPVAPNGLAGRGLVALRGVSDGDRSLAALETPSVTLEVRGPRPVIGTEGMSARGERIGDRVAPVSVVGSSKVLEERRGSAGPRSTEYLFTSWTSYDVVGGTWCAPSKLGADAS
jgi:hypothetical protein